MPYHLIFQIDSWCIDCFNMCEIVIVIARVIYDRICENMHDSVKDTENLVRLQKIIILAKVIKLILVVFSKPLVEYEVSTVLFIVVVSDRTKDITLVQHRKLALKCVFKHYQMLY